MGDPDLRVVLLFVRAQPRAVTSADVAETLALPRTVARWRLEKLLDAGLLTTGFERRSGRSGPGAGRPAKTYAPAADTAAIEFPRRRYEELLRVLLDAVPRRRRAAQLEQVGIAYGRALAAAVPLRRMATVPRALEHLCHGLSELGFHAAVDSITPERAEIVTATCPLRPLVFAESETRAIDQGMWRGLVEATTKKATVSCRTRDCLHAESPCRIRITFN